METFTEKEKIKFEIDRSKTEGLLDIDKDIFPSHFTALICGWPGSGKTTLLKFMLQNDKLLKKKFDEILILSPSCSEFKVLLLPNDNVINSLNWGFINAKMDQFNQLYRNDPSIGYTNVLIVIDDFISELNKEKNSVDIKKIIFNRRHLLDYGMVSVIITSQKYSLVPPAIRSTLTMFFSFQLNNICIEKIKKEIIRQNTKTFHNIQEYIFKGIF